ncbi:hypothetical protein Q0M94_19535 (plasmid) [Deinococcus radiomollis]|uniref:hypothetical protein n=1 Tax=Deinococcus radiomollis TaxID=468916 RepID=UPI003891903B
MTAFNHDRLHRVLQLALTSPYEGEREKAVGLFLGLLEKTGLSLHQIDRSFEPDDGMNALRKRAGLAAQFSVLCNSREEAVLYGHLVRRFSTLEKPVQFLEAKTGFEVRCILTPLLKAQVDRAFTVTRVSLPGQLAVAQQQALKEYQARRQQLFEEIIRKVASTPLSEDSLRPEPE